MTTLKLDPETWDLFVDANGNIALLTDTPSQTVQDVATSCRLWKGDYIYDVSRGIPYMAPDILGQQYYQELFSYHVQRESRRIPTCANADVRTFSMTEAFEQSGNVRDKRTLRMEIRVVTTDGEVANGRL